MSKPWSKTVEAHRHDVRNAVMDTTADLVSGQGLRAVTMSEIAEKAGIGRATLYKYFPDVESIMLAWHERHISGQLEHLVEVGNHATDASERLRAVFEAYALHLYESRSHQNTELSGLVHRGEHVERVGERLDDYIRVLLADAARAGGVREDIAAAELAAYCTHSLSAAGTLTSKAAVRRLVQVTLDALRPPL